VSWCNHGDGGTSLDASKRRRKKFSHRYLKFAPSPTYLDAKLTVQIQSTILAFPRFELHGDGGSFFTDFSDEHEGGGMPASPSSLNFVLHAKGLLSKNI
jgi:hypothetical protein